MFCNEKIELENSTNCALVNSWCEVLLLWLFAQVFSFAKKILLLSILPTLQLVLVKIVELKKGKCMKISLVLVLLFVFVSCNQFSKIKNDAEFDHGSGIELGDLTPEKLENLRVTGMVWGFLKYYHPNVAAGNYNWDYELFRILPSILSASSFAERDAIFLSWINSLGGFTLQDSVSKEGSSYFSKVKHVAVSTVLSLKGLGSSVDISNDEHKLKPDLDWIHESNLSDVLERKLTDVRYAKRDGSNCYVDLKFNVGNPVFNNENPYASMDFTDDGYRILALFRYWNIIQYCFPYKDLIGRDWKTVLPEYITKFATTESEIDYKLALLLLIGEVHDSHAQVIGKDDVLTNYFGNRFPVVELSYIENQMVVTGFVNSEKETGLAIGDVIISKDKEPVDSVVHRRLPYNSASNNPTKFRNLSRKFLRTSNSEVEVSAMRGDSLFTAILPTYSFEELKAMRTKEKEEVFKMITPDIAYVKHSLLSRKNIDDVWENIGNSRGIIIDNRNYPGDFVIFKLSRLLLPEKTSFVKFTNGSLTQPGLFSFTKELSVGEANRDHYKGKVVILVNETTQSSAEYHTMAYQTAPDVVVIGSTTAGADGNISKFYLPGNVQTMITGIGVYYPDGRETQRVGIVPDIEVHPTIEGVRNNRDELIEKAISYIKE